MRKVEAVVRKDKLELVKRRLSGAGVSSVTTSAVQTSGDEPCGTIAYRGVLQSLPAVGKVKLEMIVADDLTESAVDAISLGARTGEPGDGVVLVLPLDSVVQIQTGATWANAFANC